MHGFYQSILLEWFTQNVHAVLLHCVKDTDILQYKDKCDTHEFKWVSENVRMRKWNDKQMHD